MSVAVSLSSWAEVCDEIGPLWARHYDEIADHRIPLDPDWDRYGCLADLGNLHVVAARDGGALVGYLFAFVDWHMHYKSTLFASFDLYYVAPEYRTGLLGLKLFREAERTLKARGVRKIIGNTKLEHDASVLFLRLGWSETERIFTKYIGD